MRGSQLAWTEQAMETRHGIPQNGGNGLVFDQPRSKQDPVHREGSGVPQNGGNGPPTVETGVLLIGRGVAYRKMDKTDLCWSATVETGPVHREGCGVPQNGTPRDTVHLHRRPPPASTDYCGRPPASTGSCSSSLHRALLHRLLFNHPSTVYYSSTPPHHGVLFNHPSTGTPPPSTVHPALHTTGSCSTTPPPSTVHPTLHTTGSCSSTPPRAPLHRLLFIQPSTTPRGPVHPEAMPPLTFHPDPPRNAHCSSNRWASVSSNSEGITRLGSFNSHRSIARVQ